MQINQANSSISSGDIVDLKVLQFRATSQGQDFGKSGIWARKQQII